MKIFVTGGAGFIGSHLCESLLSKNHTVVAIDNFDPFYDRSLKEANISGFKNSENFTLIENDLCNETFLDEHFSQNKYDAVVHLAAKAGVRPSLKEPTGYVKANVDATVSLMNAMEKNNIKNFIFISSSSIYGKSTKIPFKEETDFDDAISVYAATKQSGEIFTRMFHNLYDFNVINLRLFTVYGPRQRPDLAIHKFLKASYLQEEITLFGDGSMARDYTFVLDTVTGIEGALNRVTSESGLYETYNLGNSSPVSLKNLIESIEETTQIPLKIKKADVPPGDVPITFADISKAQKMLNYRPEIELKEGLHKMAEWIRELYL
jgi:UDP-glucuronate 4-epimerase